jgi:hypothetical protein
MLPEYAPLLESAQLGIKQEADKTPMDALADAAESLRGRLGTAELKLKSDAAQFPLSQSLRASLANAIRNLRALVAGLNSIAAESERLAEETDFSLLVDSNRQILSIGYEMGPNRLHPACYDMLASEARIATFLAVARGDLEQVSWFKLGRDFAHAYGQYLLLSWTGTMFEYLMPALWMRSYPDTLVSRTQAACVQVQRAFARSLNIPWGISESGSSAKDDAGHYHYHAYGVPPIALWCEATAGPIVSPYSSFLALNVDSLEALKNLRRMASSGWIGACGYYEAVDYSTSSGRPVLVREWMAHHQGMSLLAIVNLLRENVVQRWFHANPLVQATELILHEMPVSPGALRARFREFAPTPAAKAS